MTTIIRFLAIILALAILTTANANADSTVHYRFATIDGVKMFYREAGPADGPVVLLLHGFPTSSHMFRNLIPLLSDRYHVIAPDYPGFGQSDSPDRAQYKYTFAGFTDLIDALLGQRGITRYTLYLMDYGAPVGYRLALKHPERVSGLIIQNGNAYEEGLRDFWIPVKAYWKDPSTFRERDSGLGQERQDLSRRGRPSLSQGPARCGVSPLRLRPLPARGQARRGRSADP